jgi:hypothetical protein
MHPCINILLTNKQLMWLIIVCVFAALGGDACTTATVNVTPYQHHMDADKASSSNQHIIKVDDSVHKFIMYIKFGVYSDVNTTVG